MRSSALHIGSLSPSIPAWSPRICPGTSERLDFDTSEAAYQWSKFRGITYLTPVEQKKDENNA
jgi:hypothetical protein